MIIINLCKCYIYSSSPNSPKGVGDEILYLPAYSRDFNEIEHQWFPIKNRERKNIPFFSNNFNFTKEFFHHHETNSTSDDIQRYHLLWKSVISQAVTDSVSNCKKTESLVEKLRAISWLSDFSQDFVYTCILANYDSAYVRSKIRPILACYTKKPDKV